MEPQDITRHTLEAYERKADKKFFPAAETSAPAHDLATELKLRFLESTRKSLSFYSGTFSEEEIRDITRQEKDMLSIEIYDSHDLAQSRLRDFGYSKAAEQILPDETLLVIHLSEPMREKFPEEPGLDLSHQQKVWKEIYEQTIPQLWRLRDTFADQFGVHIERINPVATHDPNNYYYLWVVSPAGRKPIEVWSVSDSEHGGNNAHSRTAE